MGLFKGFVEGKTKKMRISLGKAAAFGDQAPMRTWEPP